MCLCVCVCTREKEAREIDTYVDKLQDKQHKGSKRSVFYEFIEIHTKRAYHVDINVFPIAQFRGVNLTRLPRLKYL